MSEPVCSNCLENRATHRCKRCKAAYFCSEKCRVNAWNDWHSHDCVETKIRTFDPDPTFDINAIIQAAIAKYGDDYDDQDDGAWDDGEDDNSPLNLDYTGGDGGQDDHELDNISDEMIDDIGATALPTGFPPQPPALDHSFKKRSYYRASAKKIRWLRRKRIFAWMCLVSFKTSPLINAILFKVNGDLTKLDQTFMGVVKEKARTAKLATGVPGDPYPIFHSFFKLMLVQGVERGRPLRNPKTGQPIVRKRDFVKAFPKMRRYLEMRDKALFVRHYVYALQSTITSLHRTKSPTYFFRGFRPLGIPNTITLSPSQMYVGQEITNWGFMSVSVDSRVSTLFTDSANHCCMLEVIIPSTFPVFIISSDISDKSFPQDPTGYHQMEILLPVGSVFRVTKAGGGANTYKSYRTPWKENPMHTFATAQLVLIGMKPLRQ